MTYSNFHPFLGDLLQTAHDVLLHLNELRQLLREVGPESAGRVLAKGMPLEPCQPTELPRPGSQTLAAGCDERAVGWPMDSGMLERLPKAPLPKSRPDLVLEGGGGGFCAIVASRCQPSPPSPPSAVFARRSASGSGREETGEVLTWICEAVGALD